NCFSIVFIFPFLPFQAVYILFLNSPCIFYCRNCEFLSCLLLEALPPIDVLFVIIPPIAIIIFIKIILAVKVNIKCITLKISKFVVSIQNFKILVCPFFFQWIIFVKFQLLVCVKKNCCARKKTSNSPNLLVV